MLEIEKVIHAYECTDWKIEKAALGIVVKVEGSSYRRIGARMFVKDNGTWVGGISGGCLEGDALRQAQKAIIKHSPSLIIYDTTEEDEHQIGIGLGCNGRIEVLFIPIDGSAEHNHIEFLKTIVHQRKPNILFQVIASNDRNTDWLGSYITNISDLSDKLDVPLPQLDELSNKVLKKRKSNVFKIVNNSGEEYHILAELILPKIKLICVGDNYDVMAMLELAKVLNWEIELVGKRRKYSRPIHKVASKTFSIEDISTLHIDEYTAVVLMSHDFKTDLQALKQLIGYQPKYIGCLGPKKRLDKLRAKMLQSDNAVDISSLSFIYGPTGLDIGAVTPEEISISIISEIISVFRNREGGHLKDRTATINDRIEWG